MLECGGDPAPEDVTWRTAWVLPHNLRVCRSKDVYCTLFITCFKLESSGGLGFRVFSGVL